MTSKTSKILNDPVAVLDQLDIDAIVERLQAIEREQNALRALLRAAKAREREREKGSADE
jgi:hypothetical protein